MKPKILLLNPAIYDFTSFDFWLKPYGLLHVAGFIQEKAELSLFDYMDRQKMTQQTSYNSRKFHWGQGRYDSQEVEKPKVFTSIKRNFKRFGRSRQEFQNFLAQESPFDYCLLQTVMTYWYLGIEEAIDDLKTFMPECKIIIGGAYASICTEHAKKLKVDLVIEGNNLSPLWQYLKMKPAEKSNPPWELYETLYTGVIKISDGCPFKCTYCSVPSVYGKYSSRKHDELIFEIDKLYKLGVKDIAFYDDSLLFHADKLLIPLLQTFIERKYDINLHAPNALNVRFITQELALLMVQAGFKTIYLGFESRSIQWQKATGNKAFPRELERAVSFLLQAGADRKNISTYIIIGHPQEDKQDLFESIKYVNSLGVKVMLNEFSPIPGTVDGEFCRKFVDLDEPLCHNKTYFPLKFMGEARVQEVKALARELNSSLN